MKGIFIRSFSNLKEINLTRLYRDVQKSHFTQYGAEIFSLSDTDFQLRGNKLYRQQQEIISIKDPWSQDSILHGESMLQEVMRDIVKNEDPSKNQPLFYGYVSQKYDQLIFRTSKNKEEHINLMDVDKETAKEILGEEGSDKLEKYKTEYNKVKSQDENKRR